MKKVIFGGLLLGSIGLNFYLLNTEVIVKSDLDSDINEMNDQISIAQSAVQKKSENFSNHTKNIQKIKKDFLPALKQKSNANSDNKEKDTISSEKYEEDYQKSQINWQESLTEYMEVDLGLLPEHVDRYFDIQKQREGEISEYMTPRLTDESDGSYYFTVEDNVAMGKINEKYLNKLKSTIGIDAYREYSKFRQNYNKRKNDQGGPRYFVEF